MTSEVKLLSASRVPPFSLEDDTDGIFNRTPNKVFRPVEYPFHRSVIFSFTALFHGASHLFPDFVIQYSAEDIKNPWLDFGANRGGLRPRSPVPSPSILTKKTNDT